MKLIIAGGTGLVATEVIRQSLQLAEITEVIALARKPVRIDGIESSKLKSVVINDYGEYPDHIKAEFATADACIWWVTVPHHINMLTGVLEARTVAITPFRTSGFDFAEVKRVCYDCTLAGLKAIYDAGPSRSCRFVYLSAEGTPQDLTKEPLLMGKYQLMRGETENMVRLFGAQHEGIEVCVAQPGVVTSSATFWRAVLALIFGFTNIFTHAFPNLSRKELAAALLDQVVYGFEKETLRNADLVRLGRAVLKVL